MTKAFLASGHGGEAHPFVGKKMVGVILGRYCNIISPEALASKTKTEFYRCFAFWSVVAFMPWKRALEKF